MKIYRFKLCECGCGEEVKPGKRFVKYHYGRMPKPESHKRKIGEANSISLIGNIPWNKGTKGAYSEEYIAKLRESHLGQPGYWTGKERDEEMNKVISAKVIKLWENSKYRKRHTGENHHNWQGGLKFPYSQDWTEDLKDAIRKRDGYKCQMCGSLQEALEIKLSVHHIDYDKGNCDPENLISICTSCHAKTSAGKRIIWMQFFEKLNRNEDKYLVKEYVR